MIPGPYRSCSRMGCPETLLWPETRVENLFMNSHQHWTRSPTQNTIHHQCLLLAGKYTVIYYNNYTHCHFIKYTHVLCNVDMCTCTLHSPDGVKFVLVSSSPANGLTEDFNQTLLRCLTKVMNPKLTGMRRLIECFTTNLNKAITILHAVSATDAVANWQRGVAIW